jgi:hypothetical protein
MEEVMSKQDIMEKMLSQGLNGYKVMLEPTFVTNTKTDGKKTTFCGCWLNNPAKPYVLVEVNVYTDIFWVTRTFLKHDTKSVKVLRHETAEATLQYIRLVMV